MRASDGAATRLSQPENASNGTQNYTPCVLHKNRAFLLHEATTRELHCSSWLQKNHQQCVCQTSSSIIPLFKDPSLITSHSCSGRISSIRRFPNDHEALRFLHIDPRGLNALVSIGDNPSSRTPAELVDTRRYLCWHYYNALYSFLR